MIQKRGRNGSVLEDMGGSKTWVCGPSEAEVTKNRIVMTIKLSGWNHRHPGCNGQTCHSIQWENCRIYFQRRKLWPLTFIFFYAGGHGYLIGNHYWLCCVGYAHVSKKLIKMEIQDKSVEVDLSIHILQLTSSPFLKWLAKNRPQEANAEFAAWKLWVGVNCTWLYIGSQDAWAVFIIYLFFRLPYCARVVL